MSNFLETKMVAHIRAHGPMPFAQFMHMALFDPERGYYATAKPFGSMYGRDFVTSAELGTLFGLTLARVLEPLIKQGYPVMEVGPGSGALARCLLGAWEQVGLYPSYALLELSEGLAHQQRELLTPWGAQTQWLNDWPSGFSGIVLGNEVLDALPIQLCEHTSEGWKLRAVDVDTQGVLCWTTLTAPEEVIMRLHERAPKLPVGSVTEIGLEAENMMYRAAQSLTEGCMVWIDYGFDTPTFYHPQRMQGTLMCHYQHQRHADPLLHIGQQDITAHVDFGSLINIAQSQDLTVHYTTQARFLMNAGLLDIVLEMASPQDEAYPSLAREAQMLLSETHMGEVFKTLVCGRGKALDCLSDAL